MGCMRSCYKKFLSREGGGEIRKEDSCPLQIRYSVSKAVVCCCEERGKGSMHELVLEEGGG